jgi:hypothetical protein
VNFQGFVPFRRAVLEHVQTGKLSTQEFAAFTALVLLADKETGAGRINAPVLMSWLPDLSYDAAKRVLLNLETKRYIFREIVPYSKRMYRYWVNKYIPSAGPYRLLQTNLSKVFDSKDPNDIEYVNPAPQTPPQGAPQTPPQGAPYNDKDKEKEKDNPPTDSETCVTRDSDSESNSEHSVSTKCKPCDRRGEHMVSRSDSMVSTMCARGDSMVSTMCSTSDSPVNQKCIEEPLHVRRLAELKRQVEEMSNQ